MIVSRRLALLAAVALGLWAALGSPTGTRAQTPAVAIQDFAFKPETLTIAPGTTVTWTNRDSTIHTATSDSGVWDSKTLNQGQSYSFTFQQAGTYPYHCDIHPFMTGQIVVTAASAPTATATSTATQSAGGPSPQATPTATGTTAPTVTATDTATAVPSPTVTPLKALKIAVHGKPSVGHRTNLQVRVTGAGGQPVAGASVVCDARKAGVPKQRHAKTGKNGTVTIKSVLPKKRGAIRLTASHSGYKTVSKTVQVKK